MQNEPLFLAKGSIRAILTLMLTAFVISCVLFKVIIPETIFVIWAGAVGLYFGSRMNFNEQEENEQ